MSKGYTATIYAHAYGGYYAPLGGVEPTTRWARLQAIDQHGNPLASEVHEIRQVAPVTNLNSPAFRGRITPETIFQETEIIEHSSGKLGFPVGRAYVIRLGQTLSGAELQSASRKATSGCLIALSVGTGIVVTAIVQLV